MKCKFYKQYLDIITNGKFIWLIGYLTILLQLCRLNNVKWDMGIMMNLQCVMLWKDVIMKLSWNSPRKTEENHIHTYTHTHTHTHAHTHTHTHTRTHTHTYIPCIYKCIIRTVGCGTCLKYTCTNLQCKILDTFYKNIINHLSTQKILLQSKRSVYVGIFLRLL